jgi:hypothetical protein
MTDQQKTTEAPGQEEVFMTKQPEATMESLTLAVVKLRNQRDELVLMLENATATIAAIYQWIDAVEKAGGATSVAGVAKCHAMLNSLRRNAVRTEVLVLLPARRAIAEARKQ